MEKLAAAGSNGCSPVESDEPTSQETGRFRLAIVGGGPRGTYALERLAMTADRLIPDLALEVHVFERTGEFGAGAVHSARQPRTNVLNRIASQIGFAADETLASDGPLRDRADRPTLHEWCRARYAATGEGDLDLDATDWPRRYVHGLALNERFRAYHDELDGSGRAHVELHVAEVVDIVDQPDGRLLVRTAADDGIVVDHVLLVTGHSTNDPVRSGSSTNGLARFAAEHEADFLASVYPLEERLTETTSGPGQRVACNAMGVAAIDQILFLTEGRGGTFADDGAGGLRYRPSGREPGRLHAFSRSGLFPYARPVNLRSLLPDGGAVTPTALTIGSMERLRRRSEAAGHGGQLDFVGDVLPLIAAEMALLHHGALFGDEVGRWLRGCADEVVEGFLQQPVDVAGRRGAVDRILAPLDRAVEEVVVSVEAVLDGRRPLDVPVSDGWSVAAAIERWTTVVHGPEAAAEVVATLRAERRVDELTRAPSPFALDPSPRGNLFRWSDVTTPIDVVPGHDPAAYRQEWLDFMARDVAWASQGNIDNPYKVASDGAWRDLRPVFSHAIDEIGLTADSHREFVDVYYPLHNRLVNGTSLEVARKLIALVEADVLDISVGPGAEVHGDPHSGRFVIRGPLTGTSATVDTVAESRVHRFHAQNDESPLFPNMLERGLVSLWRRSTDGQADHVPGFIDVTDRSHPIAADGAEVPQLTVLGPATCGRRFFQFAALRPDVGHFVMKDLEMWIDDLWDQYDRRAEATPAGRLAPLEAAR